MSAGQTASTSADALVMCIYPDVCWTPLGSTMVAVAYMIVGRIENAIGTAQKYLVNDKPAFTMASRIPTVEGNEAGTGGGIISGVNRGWCRPIEHSKTFQADGHWLVREGDLVAMNCNGPEGPANTHGRVVILSFVASSRGVSLSKASAISIDPGTGAMVVEEREIFRHPETGAVTEIRHRSVIDSTTREAKTEFLVITTEQDGKRRYEAAAGTFDPARKAYSFKTTSGELPDVEPGEGERELANAEMWKDGQLYLGEGEEAVCTESIAETGADVANDDPAQIDDPELLDDPAVKEALEEKARAEAEHEALEREKGLELLKTTLDIAGFIDPSPTSDMLTASICLVDGDWVGLGLSLIAIAPYIGDVIAKPIKGVLTSARVARIVERMAAIEARLGRLAPRIKKALDEARAARMRLRARRAAPRGEGAPTPPEAPPSPGDGGFTPKAEGPEAPRVRQADGENAPEPKKKRETPLERRERQRREALKRRQEEAEAKGLHKHPEVSIEEEQWLADPRQRGLAYDPARGQFNVEEGKLALKAEEGTLTPPLRRASDESGGEMGADYFDGNDTAWDFKSAKDPSAIQDALKQGEHVLVHGDQATVNAARQALNASASWDKLRFMVTGP